MVAQRKLMASPVVPVVLCIVVLLVVWEGAILLFGIPPFVLPSLDAIVRHAFSDTGRLMAALLSTLGEALGHV